MKIDQSLALGSVATEDGLVVIRGWILAPASIKVLIRFETLGTQDDQVEGLHWSSIGGWYKYLPATGKVEYFEVDTYFKPSKHGVPKMSVQRWAGDGEIDLVIDGYTGPYKLGLWSNSTNRERLISSLEFPTEFFELEGGLVSTVCPHSVTANENLLTPQNKRHKNSEGVFSRSALEEIRNGSFDALVVDVESLLFPIAKVGDAYIEASKKARTFRTIPLGTPTLTLTEPECWSVFLRALESVVIAARPRQVIALLPASCARASNTLDKTPPEDLDGASIPWSEVVTELKSVGAVVLYLNSDKTLSSSVNARIRQILDHGSIIDGRTRALPSTLPERSVASKYEIQKDEPLVIDGPGVTGNFFVEVDLRIPLDYPARNLILVLSLETPGDQFELSELRKDRIYQSSLAGVEYFKYVETQEGYRHYRIPVFLPESVVCRGIGFGQVRSKEKVAVQNVVICAESCFQ